MRKFIAAVIFVAGVIPANARSQKIASDVPNRNSGSLEVIIQFRHRPTTAHVAKILGYGGTPKSDLSLVKALHAAIPANRLQELANDPEVSYISPDRRLSRMNSTIAFNVPSPAVDAPYAWSSGLIGSGIGIAVVDSGTQDANDMENSSGKNRIIYKQSYISGTTGTVDVYGHGIHIAGLIAGNGKSSNGQYKGVAPNANILNFRVLNDSGMGQDSYVISAIQAAIQLKSKYNIRVLNLSLGRPVYESYKVDPLCQAVEQAWKAGIVVVVAAGNEGRNNSAGTNGYGTIMAPGNDPYVITVGAMNSIGTINRRDDKITSYSSKGPTQIDHIVKPDLVAPGNRILSLRDQNQYLDVMYPSNRVPRYVYMTTTDTWTPDYYQLSGTSMSAPMVSGAVALMLQKDSTLTPDTVKARLMKSAMKLPAIQTSSTDPATGVTYISENDAFTVGAGYLDIQAALASSDVATAAAISPVAKPDGNEIGRAHV